MYLQVPQKECEEMMQKRNVNYYEEKKDSWKASIIFAFEIDSQNRREVGDAIEREG